MPELPDPWTICKAALEAEWRGEWTPSQVVDCMCAALDGVGDATVRRDEFARQQGRGMVSMVFAELDPEPADAGAVVSNALRAMGERDS